MSGPSQEMGLVGCFPQAVKVRILPLFEVEEKYLPAPLAERLGVFFKGCLLVLFPLHCRLLPISCLLQ